MTSSSNGAGDREALRAGIRQTRAELGETLQVLAGRMDVKARLRDSVGHTGERVRGQVGQTAATVRHSVRDAGGAARRHALPWGGIAAAVAVAVVVVLVNRGRLGVPAARLGRAGRRRVVRRGRRG